MSYSAVCTKAAAANRARSSREKPPSSSAVKSEEYCAADVTTATFAWFFAAPRTIDGPPMSICSMHSSTDAPEATVSVNGYRLLTSRSNGSTRISRNCST